MTTLQIELTEAERAVLDALAREKHVTTETLAQETLSALARRERPDEHQKFLEWREALLGIEGMWKHRDDLPDFEELRKSWDRDAWSRA